MPYSAGTSAVTTRNDIARDIIAGRGAVLLWEAMRVTGLGRGFYPQVPQIRLSHSWAEWEFCSRAGTGYGRIGAWP